MVDSHSLWLWLWLWLVTMAAHFIGAPAVPNRCQGVAVLSTSTACIESGFD